MVARVVGEFDGGRFFGCCHLVFNFARWIVCSDEVCCHDFGSLVVACARVAQWPCLSLQHQLKFCSCPGLTDKVRVKDVAMFQVHAIAIAPCIGHV